MAETTQEQVLEAARSFGSEDFTREDVADKLGVDVESMQPSWKALKQDDQLEKVREEDGKRFFKLAGQ